MSELPNALENISAEQFTATEIGQQWLVAHPAFLELAKQFCAAVDQPEELLKNHSDSFIGAGYHSEVWELGGIAVKVSSPTTGEKHRNHATPKGDRVPIALQPENLIHQFNFLNTLRQHLAISDDQTIEIPEQYFAFRSVSGHYLRAEEHMSGWMPLKNVIDARDYTNAQYNKAVNHLLKRKVLDHIRPIKFRLGLSDLGLEDPISLSSGNILVPIGTVDPESSKLCIIDQPGRGTLGRLGMTLLSNLNQAA